MMDFVLFLLIFGPVLIALGAFAVAFIELWYDKRRLKLKRERQRRWSEFYDAHGNAINPLSED